MGSDIARSFVYLHASDLEASRVFYNDVVGLNESFCSTDVIGFQHGSMQITIERNPIAPEQQGWSRQLGWQGGTRVTPSFGFEVACDDFAGVVERCREVGVPTYLPDPQWVGYWSLVVKDPSGNTVEISTPQADAWSMGREGDVSSDA